MRVANALFRPIGKGCLGVSRVACTTAGPLRVCVCVCVLAACISSSIEFLAYLSNARTFFTCMPGHSGHV